jgi:ribonucleoside-diphosphate reductase alpha chain
VTSHGFIRRQGLVVYSNDGSAALAKSPDQDTVTMRAADPQPVIKADVGSVTSGASMATSSAAQKTSDRVQQARMQGYEGEACPECQNFTLVRNGTCLKCNTCGGTTGCS